MNMRHRICAGPHPRKGQSLWVLFCGAAMPMRHRIRLFCGAARCMRHRISEFCGAPRHGCTTEIFCPHLHVGPPTGRAHSHPSSTKTAKSRARALPSSPPAPLAAPPLAAAPQHPSHPLSTPPPRAAAPRSHLRRLQEPPERRGRQRPSRRSHRRPRRRQPPRGEHKLSFPSLRSRSNGID